MLSGWLGVRGQLVGQSVKLYRATAQPPHIRTDLRIERIGREAAGVVADVAIAGYSATEEWRRSAKHRSGGRARGTIWPLRAS